ncbi:PREDICTED: uncharacterized protein LOC106820067 isoform X2 [Priapulus caudatus]|nr:PREDICTED: uncharacterized protein LOC106820067 isoform X2 [Priapulus caudatus]
MTAQKKTCQRYTILKEAKEMRVAEKLRSQVQAKCVLTHQCPCQICQRYTILKEAKEMRVAEKLRSQVQAKCVLTHQCPCQIW